LTGPSDRNPASLTVEVPDLGGVEEASVLEVLVSVGDRVEVDTPLVTLESEKATMDVPSSCAGVVVSLVVRRGDKVRAGMPIVVLQGAATEAADLDDTRSALRAMEPYGGEPYLDTVPIAPMGEATPADPSGPYDFDLTVLGAGPGGYAAAFRAADLGLKVALIERSPTLGGVCLNVGCIPSKALLHAARIIEDARTAEQLGIRFGAPVVDVPRLREWKDGIVGRMTRSLATLAKQRKVTVIRGSGRFTSAHELQVDDGGAGARVSFRQCVIAVGSEPVQLPGFPRDPRVIDSTGALDLDLPGRLLVVGGGIIGLEMATVYDALGVKVSVVELTDGLLPGCDRDLVRPLAKRVSARYERVMLGTRVTTVEVTTDGLRVSFDGAAAPDPQLYDKVLVAVGRSPNGRTIHVDDAGVSADERGYIAVDRQMRTNVPHIFAIGDVVGQPMLAHKATHQGKVAAEAAAGEKSFFDARVVPSVAYTDPEVAWVGLTETDAKTQGIAYERAAFPWSASGRALTLGLEEGSTKLLFDPGNRRVLGGGIVGSNAGDLIAEVALAIEMGADAADIGLTIHAHPTLAETVGMAAEALEGTLTDLFVPRRKKAGPA
jgi:dihydrolipoamide dehydrogenase